jgi:phospholipase C
MGVLLLARAAVAIAAAAADTSSSSDGGGGSSVSSSSRHSRPFSREEFAALKSELHLLSAPDAERRFAEVRPLSRPPPRQDKIDHVVVLFMENRAFDHVSTVAWCTEQCV